MITIDTASLPRPAAADRAKVGRERWLEAIERHEDGATLRDFARAWLDTPEGTALADAIFGNSPFLTQLMILEPVTARDFLENGPDAVFERLLERLKEEFGTETAVAALMKGLRQGKRRAALLIALSDIARLWTVDQVTQALSDFADIALQLSIRLLLRDLAAGGKIALPATDAPEVGSGLVVIAMGKLGAAELNYSSDIDLMVLYDPDTMDAADPENLTQDLVRMTRQLMRIMDERTADGYVFRTDMRVRPDPGTTPLAIPIQAAETYYESVGQNWERCALIRARPVAGDLALGKSFLDVLRPFVWRKHLDFAALEDIHSIKRQITAHRGGAKRAVNGHNIKLGRGGIREIEFYAQTQQLIWGGRNPELRTRKLVETLEALAAHGQITAETVDEMAAAYRFLRTLEHRLQMVNDEQTQELPKQDEKIEHIALFMGFPDADSFRTELMAQMERVEENYANLFEESPNLGGPGSLVFTGSEPHPDTVRTLEDMGFKDGASISGAIRNWHHGRYRSTRSERARQLLTELMPRLLEALAHTANPNEAFAKFDEFLGNLPAGVQILSLFYSNPPLLDLVADIMGSAPRLAGALSRNPQLLDHVLTSDFYNPLEEPETLEKGLDHALEQARDYQDVIDITRRWANDAKFQAGVQILKGIVDGERAGPWLSGVADNTIRALWPWVEAEFRRQHGRVPGGDMAVMAFGKLGSCEMTPESDLDLVFVYDHEEGADQSDGEKGLFPNVYYMRASQRLVTGITAMTGEGRLYEVDLRLRPQGSKGPAASRLDGLIHYYEKTAWTWEFMALTRARIVLAGDPLREKLDTMVRAALTRRRDPEELVREVGKMRRRMAKEHRGQSLWSIKHRRGGLVDIEFLAQYLQLRHAAETPEILASNTGDALERLHAHGYLSQEDFTVLRPALSLWRRLQSVIRLTAEGVFEEEKAPPAMIDAIVRAGQIEGDFEALKQHVDATYAAVYNCFGRFIDSDSEDAT